MSSPTFDAHQRIAAHCYLQDLMRKHKGNISSAARESGRSRANFYCLLRRYGIPRRKYGGNAHWQALGTRV